jgi:hypothetical protein
LTRPVYPWIESAKSARSATWTHMVMSLCRVVNCRRIFDCTGVYLDGPLRRIRQTVVIAPDVVGAVES